METVAVQASKRVETRTKGAKATRDEGKIPCVLYGGDDVVHLAIEFKDIRHAIYTPEFKLVELDIDGEKVNCIVKDVQFHPVTEEIVHVDFLCLVPGRTIKVEVPIRFEGQAPGLRAGGKLVQKLRKVKIKATPENLTDHLIVDISELKLGSSVRVKDVTVGDGIQVMNEPSIPVASVVVPRALKGPEDEGEEGEEGEEGDETDGEGEEGTAE